MKLRAISPEKASRRDLIDLLVATDTYRTRAEATEAVTKVLAALIQTITTRSRTELRGVGVFSTASVRKQFRNLSTGKLEQCPEFLRVRFRATEKPGSLTTKETI